MGIEFRQLGHEDLELMNSLLDCFGKVFEEEDVYGRHRPDVEYMQRLLEGDSFIAIVALNNGNVIGGLAAYELKKYEQKRSEIYIYDLAVANEHRREGVATGLIETLKSIAEERGAWVIFVQADHVDAPAVQLYTKLGVREDVLNFDIPLSKT